MTQTPYSSGFYNSQSFGSSSSAQAIVPIVLELVNPRSVLDVGCGIGTWLAVFAAHGVEEFQGIDGDYVDRSKLMIPPTRFSSAELKKPFDLGRRYELVTCLEVAEHLPEASASDFVASLVKHGSVVVFSAAVPGQGGTFHINEQWPDYWAAHFATHGYVPVDALRYRIWNDPQVEYFYAQNVLIFVERSALSKYERLRDEHGKTRVEQLSLAHPSIWKYRADPRHLTLGTLLRTIPGQITRSISFRLRRLLGKKGPARMLLSAKFR